MDDFADRFTLFCKLRGLNYRTLAERVGADEAMTSRWIRGLAKPRKTAEVVKAAFGITLGELYSADLKKLRASVKKRRAS